MPKPKQTETLFRSIEVKREAIDHENRTVELAFSSEEPYERWWGIEILDHSPDSVRIERMEGGAAVLVDHDRRDHVGVVESVSIDPDRRGRAKVRFGNSARAEEIFKDVVDGIRKHVSVGYMIHKAVLEETGDDVQDTYRVSDWEPLEVSIVSVPADPTVGVGRAEDEDKHKPTFETIQEDKSMPEENDEKTIDVKAIEKNARERAEREAQARADELLQLGADYDAMDLAREYLKEGKSANEMRKALLERMGHSSPVEAESPEVGMTDKEAKRYSFVKAMNFLANPNDRKAREAAAFEIECSEAAAQRMQKAPQGILVPADILSRDLTVGTSTAGGHTVATDLLSGSFIEMLRKRSVLDRAGMTVLTDLNGNIAIPRQTGGATAYWVAESGAPTESEQAFDQVTFTPKTLGAFTDYSRKLLLQSSIDVENFVRMDLAKVIALEIDRAGLYGSGASNQPTGVANMTGINSSTFAAADPTFTEVVGLETLVAADDADVGTLSYLLDATMRGAFKTTEKASNTAQFIWEQGNTVNGYDAHVSNQIVDGDVFFGNWADLICAMWGGLDLTVDPYTHSTSGTVRIVGLQDIDIGGRHPESFCLGNDGV